MIDTSCRDWERRIVSRETLVPAFPWMRSAEAEKAVRVFNRLRLPDVIGMPRLEVATGDWMRDIVRALFGSYDPATNKRAIQEVFLLVPKKNGKSTNAAGVMVTAMIVNRRPKAELLMIAPQKSIADIAFRQAEGMIRADPDLEQLFAMSSHTRTIEHLVSGAVLQIKAADTDAITGGKATFTLVDETHVLAARPRAADVFVELRGALAARPDGFLMQITTQSKTPPVGVFEQELMSARKVRDGVTRLPLLPVLYELPEKMERAEAWRQEENWGLVNPALGTSVDLDFLRREMGKATDAGGAAMALFASQHLNVQVGLGLRTDSWAGADMWLAAEERLTLEGLLERSEVVCVGVDGGGMDDLLGLAVLGREKVTRKWLLWVHCWAAAVVLERRKAIVSTLRGFEADGDLEIVPEPGPEVEALARIVAEIDERGLLHAVGLDPYGIGEVVDALALHGIEGKDRVQGVNQGWKLNASIKTMERRLANGTLTHAGQRLMAWCVSNAKVEMRGNAIAIDKAAAGSAKIDALVAALNAVTLMSANPEAPGRLEEFLNGVVMV